MSNDRLAEEANANKRPPPKDLLGTDISRTIT